ncbi:MAG: 2-oxoglutarate dehydrogenase complex dihydrolipoyllysine-residue succinyltransferase [Gemmataceae bacterium]|nr:2-oxoglutarate dehydrogenase complex dihydrolipoyllysine-residue succinyltransferase [Gemmata sp.]MDW8198414.1 2-oxoglutarate dehydrogenase complex dihydrolipoyllysine-residue succinyltransferase [Gemmataceae bacterium]
MAIEKVIVPPAGESITEATINRWYKPDGAYVQADEPLFEMGTDKATQEVAAPVSGIVKHLVSEGQTVDIGTVIAHIDTEGQKPEGSPTPTTARTASTDGATTTPPEVIASPAAERILAEAGIAPRDVKGTGRAGRITKEDALQAAAKASPLPPAPPQTAGVIATVNGTPTQVTPADTPTAGKRGPRITREPMSPIRRRIAARLLESQNTTATLTTFNEADMTAIQELRAKYNEKFEKKHGVKLGLMSIFVKAAIEALKAFPLVNARIDGSDIIHQHFYDIGVAVSTEKGLMVPVIRDADQLSFAEIEKQLAVLAKKAREGKITVTDLEGGTFTITNGGIFGSLMSTPILNPPQVAILGMHAIQKRPVVVNDQIVIRPMMYLALSYDHRIIDGREAVQFLVRIKECVENPERILLDV